MPPKSRTTRSQSQRQEGRSTSTLNAQQRDATPGSSGQSGRIEELSSNASDVEDDGDINLIDNDDVIDEDDADDLAPTGEASRKMNMQLRTQRKAQTLQEQLFEAKLQLKDEKIRAQDLEIQLLRERRRRRSNDDDDERERSSSKRRAKSPATCDCENYSGLTLFFADCEENFRDQPSKFREEDAKVRFGSMRIVDKKRRQWRDHASCLADPPSWNFFKSYLLDLTSRPEIRAYDCEEKLEKAAQRSNQTISDFAQYLESLWVTLDTEVPNDQKTFALRNKCLPQIRHRVLVKHTDTPKEYSKLLSYFVGVEQLLRKEGTLPPLHKSHSSKDAQAGQSTRARGNSARGQRAGRAGAQSSRGGGNNTGGWPQGFLA
ncbi:MAG: hypothetical protein LQ350_008587 [Teloschistes chrysophthalmus]|nr:MAG: hypothetical protein LQ350_008587 [Niorma chrysophthalma]